MVRRCLVFKKLTKHEIIEHEKMDEEIKNARGRGPFPWPTPVDDCWDGCVNECYGDPIEGAGTLKLAFHTVGI
jgi:hypothetical protein